MEIIPESSLKEILKIDIELRTIFEDIGVNIDDNINSSLAEIAQNRIIPIKILLEDIDYILNEKKN